MTSHPRRPAGQTRDGGLGHLEFLQVLCEDEIARRRWFDRRGRVHPSKTAGLVLISNELRDHSDPAVADLAGAGLSNQIARAADAAYFGNTTAKGPNGLQSISYTTVDTGASLTNSDPFVEARYGAGFSES